MSKHKMNINSTLHQLRQEYKEELASLGANVFRQARDAASVNFTNSNSTSILTQEQMLRPIPCFTSVSKSLHFALNWSEDTVDRLTDEYNQQNRLMSREQYQNLVSSIEKIHEYMQETITSNKP